MCQVVIPKVKKVKRIVQWNGWEGVNVGGLPWLARGTKPCEGSEVITAGCLKSSQTQQNWRCPKSSQTQQNWTFKGTGAENCL